MSERWRVQEQTTQRGGAVVDRTLRFIELDDAFATLLGDNPAQLVGLAVGDRFPELVAPLLTTLTTGQTLRHVPLRVGGHSPASLVLHPLRTSRGTVAGIELTLDGADLVEGHGEGALPLQSPSVRAVLDSLFAFAGVLLPDGTLTEANRSALDAAGLTPDEVLNRPFEDAYWWSYDPAVQAELRGAIARAAAGELVRYDVVVRVADDRFIPIDFMLAPVRDEAGQVCYLIPSATDISERMEAEADLRASEERFRATFEHAPVGIVHVGLDGRWLRVNRRLCDIVGYTFEELAARTFQEITYPADLSLDLAEAEQLLAGSIESYRIEKRYVRKDGELVWVAMTSALVRTEEGQPAYFIAVVEDISQRKAAEDELRFQSQLLDAVGQGIIATTLDGTVRFWNRFAEQLYGWRREETLGRNILDLVAADLSLQQGQEIMAQLQAGESWAGTYFVRRRDGFTFPAFVTDTPLYGSDGAVEGIVGVSSDITELQRLEAEREELLLREREARKEADEALALLDTLLTTAPIGLCFLSPDYRYLRINEALAAMNGVPVAQHLGRSVREVLPDLASTVEPLFDRVLASDEPLVDLEIVEERVSTDGGRRIWRASYYPVRLSDGRIAGLGIVANDITAYRVAADALRLSEERFRVALQNSPILVYTTDRELRYTWIYNPHPSYAELNVIGRRDEELLPSDEAAKLTTIKQRVLEQQRGERAEVQLYVSGEWRVYDLTVEPLRNHHGDVDGLTVAAIDITQRRAIEEALRESEARYSALAETVPVFLFTNRPDGHNDYISQRFYTYTGAQPGSGEGQGWLNYLHPGDLAQTMTLWSTAVRQGLPVTFEYRFRRHDGAYRWFRGHAVPYHNERGVVVRWFGAALDIDDAKQAEAAREQLLARERAAVEARDSFIAIASHDLRSPLTALLGQAELLERRATQQGLPERITRSAATIAAQARRLDRMLGALLDLSRIQSGQLTIEPVRLDLAALVARCVGELEPTLTNHVVRHNAVAPNLWVIGDEVRLEQVVLNLLSNAVKYSPEGGAVSVAVEAQDGHACVVVSDQGIGIPADALPRLFERFYRASNAGASGISGLGIGLYAVQEIITLHQGTISVTSGEGQGSTFTVCLPLAP